MGETHFKGPMLVEAGMAFAPTIIGVHIGDVAASGNVTYIGRFREANSAFNYKIVGVTAGHEVPTVNTGCLVTVGTSVVAGALASAKQYSSWTVTGTEILTPDADGWVDVTVTFTTGGTSAIARLNVYVELQTVFA